MSTHELKTLWQTLYTTEPPPFNTAYFKTRLAYRLQELAFGGLGEEVNLHLEQLASGQMPMPTSDPDMPMEGTCLIREWKGAEHRVTVMATGYAYQGCLYKSLSAVARKITGSRWNGPLFFGLRRTPERDNGEAA
jgi:hypothetical protein